HWSVALDRSPTPSSSDAFDICLWQPKSPGDRLQSSGIVGIGTLAVWYCWKIEAQGELGRAILELREDGLGSVGRNARLGIQSIYFVIGERSDRPVYAGVFVGHERGTVADL